MDKLDRLGRNELFYKICDQKELDALRLMEKEENINFQDKNGYSYLHMAAQRRMLNIVKELVKKKANIDIKDKYGRTPLMIAISAYNGDRTIIDFLIENGADIHAKAKSGVSCEQLAKIKGVKI